MSLATDAMTFPQHLVLWLHVAFAIFTVGPVTLAIMSTPRYIRRRNAQVVRYLSRITFVFTIGSLGVLIAGAAIGQMLKMASKPWLIVSATLFLVAIVLLVLIGRDQRRAIRLLDEAAEHAAGQMVGQPTAQAGSPPAQAADAAEAGPAGPGTPTAAAQGADAPQAGAAAAGPAPDLATVERGRIAMLGGVVSLIYLVILVLMVWNG